MVMGLIRQNPDEREDIIRKLVFEHMRELDAGDTSRDVVATYFILSREKSLKAAGDEILYHQTTAVKKVRPGTLLAQCTGHTVDTVAFDKSDRVGLVRAAFPLKMFLGKNGTVYSTDILHVAAGAGAVALLEFPDVKLVKIDLSEKMIATFPGPKFGPDGVRRLAGFEKGRVAFGTILKPCTGITPEEVAERVEAAAENRLFLFVKEDEELLPDLSFCPLARRVRLASERIKKASGKRGLGTIIYAPHVTSNPSRIVENVRTAVASGATAVMFSEYYIGGSVRLVRDVLEADGTPVPIYGHNGGIDSHSRQIYREVLDWLARLDGIDFRQTAPVSEKGLLRPAGLEWRNSERVLSGPIPGIKPVMITRAGGLDQGNIIVNLDDAGKHSSLDNYLFLAGSAINNFRNQRGQEDPRGGARAMEQALDAFRDRTFDNSGKDHVKRLKTYAASHGCKELALALNQRYKS